jgi:Tfp pilus assembly protein FimT
MTTEDKPTLDDSMAGMFATGNETPELPPVENPTGPIGGEPAQAERTRDEQGRFASQQAQPAPVTQAPAPTTAATPDADPEKQPITKAEFKGMLEEREKRQIPSDADPEIAARIQGARTDAIFTTSERWAKKEHGEETVDTAMQWALQRAQQNPAFAAEYLKQDHPIDWAVKQQKRDAVLNQITADPEAYIQQRVAEHLAKIGQAPAAIPQTDAQPSQAASHQPAPIPIAASPAPSRSIANASSAGGLQVVPPQGEFAALDLVHKH